MPDRVTGGCLCGGVRYEACAPFNYAGHCHCGRCRKWTGAASTTHLAILHEQFRMVAGSDLLRTYRTVGKAPRVFCSRCGSSLFTTSVEEPERPVMVIHMGTLDGDPGVRPMMHELAAFKAPWHGITDALPQVTDLPE